MTPKISVVVPTYNRSHLVAACLASIIEQDFKDFEVIVVDDASTDDTRTQVELVLDERIRYVRHDQNRGGNAARNTGIQQASGEYIAFLDSDDRWAPSKLARQVALLEDRGPAYGMAYCWFICEDATGRERWRMNRTLDGKACQELFEGNWIGTFSGAVIRADALVLAGGLDEQLRSCQDWDLFVRLNQVSAICCVEDYLLKYLDNSDDKDRISTNTSAVVQGHRRMLEKMSEFLSIATPEVKARTFRRFTAVFASAGAVGMVALVSVRLLRVRLSLTNCRWSLHMLARSVRRRLDRALQKKPSHES